METHKAFCPTCGRDVNVLVTPAAHQDGQAPLADPELVCLEVGKQCTNRSCPICGVSSEAMLARRVRAGVRVELQTIVEAECEMCGRITEHVIVGADHATCAECGLSVDRAHLVLALGRDG